MCIIWRIYWRKVRSGLVRYTDVARYIDQTCAHILRCLITIPCLLFYSLACYKTTYRGTINFLRDYMNQNLRYLDSLCDNFHVARRGLIVIDWCPVTCCCARKGSRDSVTSHRGRASTCQEISWQKEILGSGRKNARKPFLEGNWQEIQELPG